MPLIHASELTENRISEVAVGIEVPRGAMVEGLLERGFAVFAINPKQLDRFRDRYTVAGAKDDRRDAFDGLGMLPPMKPAAVRHEGHADDRRHP